MGQEVDTGWQFGKSPVCLFFPSTGRAEMVFSKGHGRGLVALAGPILKGGILVE